MTPREIVMKFGITLDSGFRWNDEDILRMTFIVRCDPPVMAVRGNDIEGIMKRSRGISRVSFQ
jgi:hypothetical protein